jgi:hypothetical protein
MAAGLCAMRCIYLRPGGESNADAGMGLQNV